MVLTSKKIGDFWLPCDANGWPYNPSQVFTSKKKCEAAIIAGLTLGQKEVWIEAVMPPKPLGHQGVYRVLAVRPGAYPVVWVKNPLPGGKPVPLSYNQYVWFQQHDVDAYRAHQPGKFEIRGDNA